jgi:hypothetical protein
MSAPNMAIGPAPLRRVAAFGMTLGARVALTFAALFLVTGAALLAISYALLAQNEEVRAQVPTYPASYIISQDRALLGNPQVPALEQRQPAGSSPSHWPTRPRSSAVAGCCRRSTPAGRLLPGVT